MNAIMRAIKSIGSLNLTDVTIAREYYHLEYKFKTNYHFFNIQIVFASLFRNSQSWNYEIVENQSDMAIQSIQYVSQQTGYIFLVAVLIFTQISNSSKESCWRLYENVFSAVTCESNGQSKSSVFHYTVSVDYKCIPVKYLYLYH